MGSVIRLGASIACSTHRLFSVYWGIIVLIHLNIKSGLWYMSTSSSSLRAQLQSHVMRVPTLHLWACTQIVVLVRSIIANTTRLSLGCYILSFNCLSYNSLIWLIRRCSMGEWVFKSRSIDLELFAHLLIVNLLLMSGVREGLLS